MQQRSGIERRRATDREPKQMGGQPNPGEEAEDDGVEQMRSPLTAREFEHPLRRAEDKVKAAASSRGNKGEPVAEGEEPPRAGRGLSQSRTHRLEDD